MSKVKAKNINPVKLQEKDIFENIWICLGILLLFWLIFFSQLLLGKAFLWDDFAQQYYPGKTMASVSLHSGEIPLWNPYTFAGMPFFADLQIAILYPFNYLISFFVSGEHISPVLLQFTIILHYLLCSIFCFFIGKQLKYSNFASVVLGLVFTYSSYMIIHMIHMPLIEAVAWFPLIFLMWLKYLDTKKYIFIILAGIAMTLCILCGYPQVAFLNYMFISIYVLIIFISKIRTKDYKFALNLSFCFILFLIIPFGISAIQLLPANEFVGLSNRASFDYDFAKQGSLLPLDLITVVVPKVFGVWTENSSSTDLKYWSHHSEGVFMFSISNVYISVLFIVLFLPAIIYIFRKKENPKLYYFLSGIMIFSILFALGGNFFLHKLLYDTLPVFNRFRNPAHILYLYCFSASIILAFGVDAIYKNRDKFKEVFNAKYFYILLAVFTFILILVLMGMFNPAVSSGKDVPAWISKQYGIFFVFLLFFSSLIFFFIKGKIKRNVFSYFLVLLLCLEFYYIWFDENNGSKNPETIFNQNSQDVKKFKEELKSEYFRINMRYYFPEGGSYPHFQRNQGMIDRIPLIEGYGALLLNRMYPFNKIDTGSTQNLDLLNVKYKIDVEKVKKNVPFPFKLNPGYLPRAAMFYDIKVIENDSVALRKYMEGKEFDYRKTLVLEKNPGDVKLPSIKDSISFPKSTVQITDYKNDKISIDVESSENGFLYLSELYYPAWKAFIDGKDAEIYRTDFCMRSVYIMQGKHKVEFIYDSTEYKSGKKISIFMLVFTFISLVFLIVKGRVKVKTKSADENIS